MNTKRSTRVRALIASVVISGIFAAAAGPAAAATLGYYLFMGSPQTPGVKSGDTCAGFVPWGAPGTKGCMFETAATKGASVSFQIHAVDTKGDGHSARTEVVISQRSIVGGIWTKTGPTLTVTDSSGRGTSRVGPETTVTRAAGTDRLKIRMRTCTYESGPGTYVTCSAWVSAFDNEWDYSVIL